MGSRLFADERKAAPSASDKTRYLPSFTDETEYITTKNANSSVMKSAYEISQRSWFSCSSCLGLRAIAPPSRLGAVHVRTCSPAAWFQNCEGFRPRQWRGGRRGAAPGRAGAGGEGAG